MKKKMRYALTLITMLLVLMFGQNVYAAGSNLSTATTVKLGTTISDTKKCDYVSNPKPHYYKFTLSQNSIVKFYFRTGGHTQRITLYLRDASGNRVDGFSCLSTNDINNWGYQSGTKYFGLNAGTYYAELCNFGNETCYYNMNISTYRQESSSVKIAGPNNNYLSTAKNFSVGNTLNSIGTYVSNGWSRSDCHYYRFSISRKQTVTFRFSISLDYDYISFRLYNASGNTISTLASCSNSTRNKAVNVTLNPGTYYIGVSSWDNDIQYTIQTIGQTTKSQTKKNQTISASNVTKKIGDKAFTLSVKRAGNGKLSYASSNKSVATITSKGKVTVKGVGKTTITITAAATTTYNSAVKKITLTVHPKGASITSLTNPSARKMTVYWKKASNVTGYQIQYATNSSFKNAKSGYVNSNKYSGAYLKNLQKGRTYYVRIRTYKTVNGVYYYSNWSSAKKIYLKK